MKGKTGLLTIYFVDKDPVKKYVTLVFAYFMHPFFYVTFHDIGSSEMH